MGTQFYTLPVFLTPLLPMRIDTFIPESHKIPSALRSALDINTALYVRDSRVADLGISRYIIRVLEHWSSQFEDFETFYRDLPFGSRIIIEEIVADVRKVRVQIVKTHYLEKQLLSWATLNEMWDLVPSNTPPLINITDVHVLKQLHDSVSLVLVDGKKCILKALTSYPKYLYHELRDLLTLPPHRNMVSRPLHLVTKRVRFGAKIAVVGFTLKYHEKGTLRDELPLRRIHGLLAMEDHLKWAVQLTDALIHIRDAGKFYCDLRLDNVVLDESDDLVMIDFEARGVALGASAPEINYREYIYTLAMENEEDDYPLQKERFVRLYEKMVRGRNIAKPSERYKNPPHGYSVPWLCLDEREREAAEVYMLGRVLWCIFEGVGSPEKTAMVQHRREDELEFPQWSRTPEKVRKLIEKCIQFDGEDYRALPVVRRGNKILLRGGGESQPSEVREVAMKWWQAELDRAEAFLNQEITANHSLDFGRPILDELLLELRNFERLD